jgi:hypothetical protein
MKISIYATTCSLFAALLISFGAGSLGAVHAAQAQAVAKNAAPDLLTVLSLKKPAAFRFDSKFGFFVGSDDAAVMIEKGKMTSLTLSRLGAVAGQVDPASSFRSLPPAGITDLFLKKNFADVSSAPEAKAFLKSLLGAKITGALFSPGNGRSLYVATEGGIIFYIDQSPVDAPSFTRLVQIPVPRAAVEPKFKTMEEYEAYVKTLPSCAQSKPPCRN